jgi:hypothetical protein
MNCGYLYETINWLLETEKRYFRLVEKRYVERMSLPFKSIATCLCLTWLNQKGIFGSGLVGKRNNYCLYNLGVYIIIAIRIIMIIVILRKVAKHLCHFNSDSIKNIIFKNVPEVK